MAAHPDLPLPDAPRWDAAQSVGNALLDRQHILLVQLTRSFAQDCAGMPPEALGTAFGDILALAQRHCAAEEHRLLLNGYEWLEQHRQEHVAGIDRLQATWAEVAAGQLPRERLVLTLQAWLLTHLVDMDLPAAHALATDRAPLGDPDGPDPLDAAG